VIALVKKKMVRARRGITGAQEPSIGGLALNCFNPFPLGDDGAFTHNTDAPSTPVIWHDDPTQQPYRPFVFTMESSAVTSIAVAADGARAVDGTTDGLVSVIYLSTGELERTIEAHKEGVRSVAVASGGGDGATTTSCAALGVAISGSDDCSARVFDVLTGEMSARLSKHAAPVLGVALCSAGASAVLGSTDHTATVWELATCTCTQTLRHGGAVLAVTLTADDRYTLTGANDTRLRLWELGSGALVRTCEGARGLRPRSQFLVVVV
jgi:WD40 repeat protein